MIEAADGISILRLTSGQTHAARLVRGWDGRAVCGASPPGKSVWDVAGGSRVSCDVCLRRLPVAAGMRLNGRRLLEAVHG